MLAKHSTAIGKLSAFMDMNKNPLKSYISEGCPIVNMSTESDDTSPVIKKKVKDMITVAINFFIQILR